MGTPCRIFAVSPRADNAKSYWAGILKSAELSEKYGLTGVLLFNGNDTYLETWVVAQELLRRTKSISPLVAVNPVYMHPFTVAKIIASLVELYGRRVHLNMIIGTALSHQKALGDSLGHDDRYRRLNEYIHIVRALLSSKRPLTCAGNYYQVDHLQLFPGIAAEQWPEFLLAGQSEAARRVCVETGSTSMQMLPGLMQDILPDVTGIHFGVVSRRSRTAAWKAARALFPQDITARKMLQYAMENTDATWKLRMRAQSDNSVASMDGYWLSPFANSYADCPYLVGAHDVVVATLQRLVQRGITTFIFDIVAREEEFENLSRVLHASEIAISR